MTRLDFDKMKKEHIKSALNDGKGFVLPKKDTE
jgi:hypothetical protein